MHTIINIFVIIIVSAAFCIAKPQYYTFKGEITHFKSYNPSVILSDFDVVLGETKVTYVFEVDFSRKQSTTSNSAGSWDYFYSDLITESIIKGHVYSEVHKSYNFINNSASNSGSLCGGARVSVSSSEKDELSWRVQDWYVGKRLKLIDGGRYKTGNNKATYFYGDLELTAISSVNPITSLNTIKQRQAEEKLYEGFVKKLSSNPDLVNKKDRRGATPLYHAVKNGLIKQVKYLLSHGANVVAPNSNRINLYHTYGSYNVLSEAARQDNTHILAMVLKQPALLKNNMELGFALKAAADSGKNKNIKLLVKSGADVNFSISTGDHQVTPIFFSVGSNNIKTTQLLIHLGCDINYQTKAGITPLIKSMQSGRKEIFDLLIAKGASIGTTSESLHRLIIECLKNPLFVQKLKLTDVIDVRLYQLSIVLDKAKRANIGAFLNSQENPIHYAAANESVEVIQLLHDFGYDVNGTNKYNQTPLFNTRLLKNAQKLLALGANVNKVSEFGETPLHKAAGIYKKHKLVELYLNEGAMINAKMNNGDTPLDLAIAQSRNSEIIATLKAYGGLETKRKQKTTTYEKEIKQNDMMLTSMYSFVFDLKGAVIDKTGKPLNNVTLNVSTHAIAINKEKEYLDKQQYIINGHFKFKTPRAMFTQLTFTKDGYHPTTITIDGEQAQNKKMIALNSDFNKGKITAEEAEQLSYNINFKAQTHRDASLSIVLKKISHNVLRYQDTKIEIEIDKSEMIKKVWFDRKPKGPHDFELQLIKDVITNQYELFMVFSNDNGIIFYDYEVNEIDDMDIAPIKGYHQKIQLTNSDRPSQQTYYMKLSKRYLKGYIWGANVRNNHKRSPYGHIYMGGYASQPDGSRDLQTYPIAHK